MRARSIVGPDLSKASTSYLERQNLTVRRGMCRFTRFTNGFSKKIENLAHAVSLQRPACERLEADGGAAVLGHDGLIQRRESESRDRRVQILRHQIIGPVGRSHRTVILLDRCPLAMALRQFAASYCLTGCGNPVSTQRCEMDASERALAAVVGHSTK